MSSPDDRLACLADRAAVALFVAACHGKQDICSRLIQSGQYALAAVEDVIKAPFTRYSRLSNRFDNRINVCIHDTTGCQTGCIMYTNIQPVVSCKWGIRELASP